jgi:serine/threonine protein kinase/predicted ATPase
MDQPLINRRYTLADKLGEGGMGAVYQAVDGLNGQVVALKRVTVPADQLKPVERTSVNSSYDMQLALAQEFRLLASLRHPHIINVLDYGFDDEQQPFFTMDYLPGAKTVVDAGRDQPLETKINLLIQALQAIAYLHRRGILHRDLKPANILMSADQVKVLDFGLAGTHEQIGEGEIAGTLAYIAPELFQGAQPKEAADLYAVGVIAYEMLVGHHPFPFKTIGELINLVLTSRPDISHLQALSSKSNGNSTTSVTGGTSLEISFQETPSIAVIVDKLLAKSPDERYDDAYTVINDLCAALDIPIPAESAAIRESFLQAARFVGRESELNTLEQALTDALDDTGSTWLIGGESGVGKSRLLDELRIRALVRGAVVLRGQAVAEGGVSYQTWREPLRRLVLALADQISDLDAGILKDLIQDIHQLLGRPVPDSVELEGTAYQQRLHGTVASLFQLYNRPILLLLEDLQWSSESLDVLRLLNGMVADMPLMIVGTYRIDERPSLPDELPEMQHFKLERLGSDKIADLSVSMLGEAGRQTELVEFLQEETEGNVFFLVEVVRALAEEAGQLQHVGRSGLPQKVRTGGIQAVIQRRLAHVPEDGRGLLRQAAIVGRELNLAILEQLKGSLDIEDWLTTCANSAVLEVREGKWQFAHDKLRQATLDSIPDESRPLLHRQVAKAIEAVYPDDPEQAATLAQHWRSAGDLDKELPCVHRAGDYTLYTSAFQDAITHFERALELTMLVDQADTTVQAMRPDLQLKLGTALKYLSDYAEATRHIETALDLYQALNDADGIARALVELGDLVTFQADYGKAAKLCEQGLDICRVLDDRLGETRALDRLCMVRFHQGDFAEATRLGEESLALSRSLQDTKGIASAINNLGIIAFAQGKYPEAATYFEETLTICQTSGERRKAATALLNMGSASGQQGDYEASNRYFEEALDIYRVIGEQRGVAMTLDNLGVIAEFQGNYQQATRYYEESLELARSIGNRLGIASTLLNLGNVARARGLLENAETLYKLALQQAQEIEAIPTILEIITGLSGVIADANRAIEWLGLVLNHSAVYDATRQLAEPILNTLREKLPAETVAAALERGKKHDLNTVVNEILKAD